MIHPWQHTQWHGLVARIGGDRLPHCLLLHGPAGVGKLHFASALSALLACHARDGGEVCGKCRGCELARAGTHPDLMEVVPEEGKQDIVVDRVRDVIERCTLTRQHAGYRCVVVHPAERMNRVAANTFLKTLEEPPAGTVFVLVTDHPMMLLPTIRSRCQVVRFSLPPRAEALAWLAAECGGEHAAPESLLDAARGAPLTALELAAEGRLDCREQVDEGLRALLRRADPLPVARDWSKLPLAEVIHWMHARVEDLIRRSVSGDIGLDAGRLYCILDEVVAARRLVASRGNPNAQLLLEHLAMAWSERSGNARTRG